MERNKINEIGIIVLSHLITEGGGLYSSNLNLPFNYRYIHP